MGKCPTSTQDTRIESRCDPCWKGQSPPKCQSNCTWRSMPTVPHAAIRRQLQCPGSCKSRNYSQQFKQHERKLQRELGRNQGSSTSSCACKATPKIQQRREHCFCRMVSFSGYAIHASITAGGFDAHPALCSRTADGWYRNFGGRNY